MQMEDLFLAAYDELRRLAAAVRRGESHTTLNPTALVHEAWLKLAASSSLAPESPRHFKRIAARAMQQILFDHHRWRKTQKRGGNLQRVPMDDLLETLQGERQLDIEALHESLEILGQMSSQQVDVVRRKFFGGQTHAEIACDLGCSVSKSENDWRIASHERSLPAD